MEPFVVHRADTIIDMKADGTGEQTETMSVSVQSDAAAKQFSVISTYFAKQSQHAEFVYLRVRHPDGTTVETPPSDAQEQASPVAMQAPFYSDLMVKQLPVKGLRSGDTLEWQTHNVRTVAETPGQIWGAENFTQGAVVEEQTVEVRVPSGLKLTTWTKPESKAVLTESDAGGKHIYRWSWKQLDPTAGAQAEALKKAKEAKPLSALEEQDALWGPLSDIAWTTFANWESVGAWYRGLEADRMMPDEKIRAKVAEITAGKATQEEKVQAVYAWVSGQVRYVGVALGLGRYQPHTAAEVLDNQYGDCKDKHTLLASMLLALGLQPDAVLVGSGIRFNQAVPSPASFNHLITRVMVDGREVWLDTTSEVAGYQVLLPVIRDKDVLVMPQTGGAVLAHTPADLPFKPEATFQVTGSLDGKLTSESTIVMTYHDDLEVLLRAAARQVSPSGYQDLVQRLMQNFGFGGQVTEAEIEHANDPSQPLSIRLHYHRDHSKDWGEDRVTATFGPTLVADIDSNNLPHAPLALDAPHTSLSTLEMKLPQGRSVELPEATHEHTAFGDCDVTYRIKGGSLEAERRTTVLEKTVPSAQLKQYAAWYDGCGAGSVPYLQMINATATDTESESSGAAEARRLINQAGPLLTEGSLDEAEADLKKAEQLDANAKSLWGDFGYLAMKRGESKSAIELFDKEIAMHPDTVFVYDNLARLQSVTGDNVAAVETLAKQQKLTPTDPGPTILAVSLLLNARDNAAAMKLARTSQALLTDDEQKDERFQFVLAQAEMRSGDIATGEAAMATMARDSTDMSRRNDASYELALAGLDLKLAEESERAVLEQLATESRSWTGHEAETILRQKSRLMIASWDTMGWILYKQGKTAEADSWIRASLTMRLASQPAEHLGDVLLAEHKPDEASKAYAIALSMLPRKDATGAVIKLPDALAEPLRTKLEAAMKDAQSMHSPNGLAASQELRTWKIGAAKGSQGTAEFEALLTPAGIASALPMGTAPQGLPERLEAATWSNRFPPGMDARLEEKVFLSCVSESCELVIAP
jgi:tetratricopeptide (TPR) repeat protein